MGLVFRMGLGGDFGAEPRGEVAPGARRFVAQNGFCGTKTHLARPLGRMPKGQLNSSTFNSAAKLCRLYNPLVIRAV